jgi:malonyl-CoA decarboxylase
VKVLGLKRILAILARSPVASSSESARQARETLILCQALLSERGEVSGARLAADVLTAYRLLDHAGLEAFFDLILEAFSPDPAPLLRAIEMYRGDSSQANLLQLQAAVESPRQELFRRFNLAPGGTGVLLDLRRQLLLTLKERPEWAGIDADLVHLFRSWFNRGFLVLQRIDWRTSALVLERLIQYEAVHQIQGWRDLRRRLEADRRCYAFFHPALPDEPLIFIEVALTSGMSAKVQPLLDTDAPVLDPASATCAMFYSITTCQEGLRGVSFGNFLIKQVAEDLGREFTGLRTFATLSPIPGFRRWLATPTGGKRLSADLVALLGRLGDRDSLVDVPIPTRLKAELIGLCASYLLHSKSGAAPLDPVARFHLANGARLQRLNWMGDTSSMGIRRSLGLMVNYEYRLADVERNHEAYAKQHKIVASREFERTAERAE